jgi:hypothetical protein
MRESNSRTHADLRLEALPSLPQSETIRAVAPRLWRDERVVAIWLGGSLAAGSADEYSDIDLRLAVAPSDLPAWEKPDFAAFLGATPLARHFLRFGESSFLHHLIAPNGDILDFLVQSAKVNPDAEATLVLGCRSDTFAERLDASKRADKLERAPASAEAVRDLIVSFWVNSHKHRKVLHRHLDLMFPAAAYTNWHMLMRLWYIEATGNDTTPSHFSGIHGLTELVRAVEQTQGAEALALCGMPTRTRAEIYAVIERHREIVAVLGRRLAERYGFEYPAALEEVTRRDWSAFRAAEDGPTLPQAD